MGRFLWDHLEGMKIGRLSTWQDIDGFDKPIHADGDVSMLLRAGTMPSVLNGILRQFVHDVFIKCPTNQNHGPFLNMSSEEKRNLRWVYMQDNVLPFHAAHLVYPSQPRWEDTVELIFPDLASSPPSGARIYSDCLYYIAWKALLNRLKPKVARIVTRAIRRTLEDSMDWLPWATPSSLWTSTSEAQTRWKTLPFGWTDTAPVVTINPKLYERHMVAFWTLRSERVVEDEDDEDPDVSDGEVELEG